MNRGCLKQTHSCRKKSLSTKLLNNKVFGLSSLSYIFYYPVPNPVLTYSDQGVPAHGFLYASNKGPKPISHFKL